MDGIGYEKWCARQLEKYGYRHIHSTRATGDQGIDLIAEYKGRTYGFQCKYYSSPVGNDAVQQAYAGMTYYQLDEAAVMTNTSFTKSARELAEETGIRLFEQMDPDTGMEFDSVYRLIAGGMAAWGVYLFFQSVLKTPEVDEIRLSILISAVFSAAVSAVAYRKYGAVLFSLGCGILFLISALAGGLHELPFTAAMAFLILLMAVHAVFMKKENLRRQYREETGELADLIRDTGHQLQEICRELLEEELGCEIRILHAERKKDGSLEMTMRAKKSVTDDVAVTIYSLNRLAEYQKQAVRFEAQVLSEHDFLVILRSS